MTVRDLIQTLLLQAPNLDAEVYVESRKDEIEMNSLKILRIDSEGSNDSLTIEVSGVPQ